MSFTEEQVAILASLGDEEVKRRIDALGQYDRNEQIATLYRQDLTPDQTVAWGRFAQSLMPGVTVNAQRGIERPRTADELAVIVADREHWDRRRKEREAREAADQAAKDADSSLP